VTYAYHTDALGSVVAITSPSGAVVASYAYDPYGGVTQVGGSDAALAERNPLRYRAYYHDTETGHYYLPARYYDPDTMRFLSPDPAPPSAGDPLTLNRYAYCVGDPVDMSDPSGAVTDIEAESWKHYYYDEPATAGDRVAAQQATHAVVAPVAQARAESWGQPRTPAASYMGSLLGVWPAPKDEQYYQDHNASALIDIFPLTGGWFNNKAHGETIDRHAYIGLSAGIPPYGGGYMRGKGRAESGIYIQAAGGGFWGGAGGLGFDSWQGVLDLKPVGFLEEGPCLPFASLSVYVVF